MKPLKSNIEPQRERLTVLILVYNQKSHLKSAFESVKMQSVFGEISVVISDDCSQDGSYELAEEIAENYPNVIARRNSTNLGVMNHYARAVSLLTTDLVAILEADDVWTRPDKLEKQMDFFYFNNEINGVLSGYSVVSKGGLHKVRRPQLYGGSLSGFLYFEDILNDNPGGSFTNYMYRTSVLLDALSKDIAKNGYDWLINLLISDLGPMGYLEGDYANYNVHGDGAWSNLSLHQQLSMKIKTLFVLEDHLQPQHRAAVKCLRCKLSSHKEELNA
jgi:glycosyltransferase involved in cell wall biosynthesis